MNHLAYQLRSEENGMCYALTIEDALQKAKDDRTIWKISFQSAPGDSIRLIRKDPDTFVLELMSK